MEESRKIRIVINFEHAQNTSQSDGSGNATVCCRSHLLPKLLRDHRSVPLPAQQRSDLVDLVLRELVGEDGRRQQHLLEEGESLPHVKVVANDGPQDAVHLDTSSVVHLCARYV